MTHRLTGDPELGGSQFQEGGGGRRGLSQTPEEEGLEVGAKARGEMGFQGKLGMMVLGDALSSALHRPALGKLISFQNSSSGRWTGPSLFC